MHVWEENTIKLVHQFKSVQLCENHITHIIIWMLLFSTLISLFTDYTKITYSGDVSMLDVNTRTTEIQLHTKTLVLRFAVEVYHF